MKMIVVPYVLFVTEVVVLFIMEFVAPAFMNVCSVLLLLSSIFSEFIVRRYIENHELSTKKILALKSFKFKLMSFVILVIMYNIPEAVSMKNLVFSFILLVIDIFRTILYENIKNSFKDRISMNKTFIDLIWLEPYLVSAITGREKEDCYSYKEFHELGPRIPILAEDLFSKWSNAGLKEDLDGIQLNAGTVSTEDNLFIRIDHSMILKFENENENEETRERSTRITFKDSNPEGFVSPSTLKFIYDEPTSKKIFQIITFERCDDLYYGEFEDNLRQINKERKSLYNSIKYYYGLMRKVKSVFITSQFLLIFIALFYIIERSTFITVLCIPFTLFLLLPSFKNLFDSIFFMLLANPFNSGDRVFIQNENLFVRKIGLLSTTLDRWNGEKIIVNNQKIMRSPILNIMRSSSQKWRVDILISAETTKHQINGLRDILNKFISTSRVYLHARIYCTEIIDSTYIRYSVILKHKCNYQNGYVMWTNHNKFIAVLITSLKTEKIKYHKITKPIEIISLQSN